MERENDISNTKMNRIKNQYNNGSSQLTGIPTNINFVSNNEEIPDRASFPSLKNTNPKNEHKSKELNNYNQISNLKEKKMNISGNKPQNSSSQVENLLKLNDITKTPNLNNNDRMTGKRKSNIIKKRTLIKGTQIKKSMDKNLNNSKEPMEKFLNKSISDLKNSNTKAPMQKEMADKTDSAFLEYSFLKDNFFKEKKIAESYLNNDANKMNTIKDYAKIKNSLSNNSGLNFNMDISNPNSLAEKLALSERMNKILFQQIKKLEQAKEKEGNEGLDYTIQSETEAFLLKQAKIQEEKISQLEKQIESQGENNENKNDDVKYLENRLKELKKDLSLYYNRLRNIRQEYVNLILSRINDKPEKQKMSSNIDFLLNRFKNLENEEDKRIAEITKIEEESKGNLTNEPDQLKEKEKAYNEIIQNLREDLMKKTDQEEKMKQYSEELKRQDNSIREDIFELLKIADINGIDTHEIRELKSKYIS